jgi:ubiquinone/menaquinone biosynthesis C-methylase UbiE
LNWEERFHKRRVRCTLELTQNAAAKKPGKLKILDVGCGEGHITEAVRREFPEAEISAVDYSVSAIVRATSRYAGIDFAACTAYRLPYPAGYFDLVICNNLWEHVPDPLRLLEEITRVSRPAGHFIVSTPNRYDLRNLFRAIVGKRTRIMSEYHVTEYSVGQVIEQLDYGGWAVKRILSPVDIDVKKMMTSIGSAAKQSLHVIGAAVLRLIGSHHSLENTVFFLAEKKAPTAGRQVPTVT